MSASISNKGQGIVELVAGIIVVVPIVLLLVDLGSLVIGVTSGDNVCREAARLASIGDPSQVQQRAQQVINEANASKGGIIVNYTLNQAAAQNVQIPPAASGGVVQGNVSVDSSITVAPPFILKAMAGNGSFVFSSHQSFPITFTIKQSVQPN